MPLRVWSVPNMLNSWMEGDWFLLWSSAAEGSATAFLCIVTPTGSPFRIERASSQLPEVCNSIKVGFNLHPKFGD